MTEFGDELNRMMAQQGISLRELARQSYCDHGYLSRVARGLRRPSAEVAAQLDAVLGAEGRLAALARRDVLKIGLGATVTAETLRLMLGDAAGEALEFTRLAGISAVGPGVLDHLDAIIISLDGAYSREPPGGLFPVARAYRVRAGELAAGPCTLREKRELYVRAAWLSELLAWLAHDLGHAVAAEAYAIDAFEHADQAGHGELCAWAADALSSITLYTGRPGRAAEAARKGITRAPAGHPLAVRLRAQAARAHARLGQREECETLLVEAAALHDAMPARTPSRPAVDTGMLASYAMTAYPASCYVWLGDFAKARTYGEQAVAVHESAPPASRSPSREAIARIDLAIALAGLGIPDEAAALGRQALASPRVVDSVRARAGDLDILLMARYPDQEDAQVFHEDYLTAAMPQPAITEAEE
jgi:transcriptional regulator with XRE-family HTH domain